MAVPGLVAHVKAERAKKRTQRTTPLPAVSRVTGTPQTSELETLDTAFRKSLFGLMHKDHVLARFEALLTDTDNKTALQAWDVYLKHVPLPRQAGALGGPGGGVKINFNFPDGDPPPTDVTNG